MDIQRIVSISGMSGLYKMVAQTKNGLIVESLIDNKRIPAYATNKISNLEDVSVYSTADDVPLKEVFQKIYTKENGGTCIDHKKPDTELRAYFKQAFPEYDEDRVYTSDIKKILTWYNILQKAGLLDKEEEVIDAEKPAVKTAQEGVKAKTSLKDNNAKPIKTAATKVKPQGVRKTGTA
jgi:hypothetical protein